MIFTIQLLLYIGIPVFLLCLAILVGGYRERWHFRQLDRREAEQKNILVTNLKRIRNPSEVRLTRLVSGQVVIATDYFKTFATTMRNLIGGEMRAAESLLTRAHREALLRMVDEARALGAREVCNVRFTCCNISQMSGNKGAMAVEILAYGTAVVRQ